MSTPITPKAVMAGQSRLQLAPMTGNDLADAASLLAARHRSDRDREPRLPAAFEEPSHALLALREAWNREETSGIVARHGDTLVGYLMGAPDRVPTRSWDSPFSRPDSADVTYIGHAVAADEENQKGDIYRAMYAALAGGWESDKLFAHYVSLPATDRNGLMAWSALGFGQAMVLATRTTEADRSGREVPGVEIRRATVGDAPVVTALAENLFHSMAEPPTLLPILPSILPDMHEQQANLLADASCPHWLAFRDGHPIGFHAVIEPQSPSWPLSPIVTPDHCVYLFEAYVVPEEQGNGVGGALLDATLAWARQTGYVHCALHHLAGAFAAGFWRNRGFRPLERRLCRLIDDRRRDAGDA